MTYVNSLAFLVSNFEFHTHTFSSSTSSFVVSFFFFKLLILDLYFVSTSSASLSLLLSRFQLSSPASWLPAISAFVHARSEASQ